MRRRDDLVEPFVIEARELIAEGRASLGLLARQPSDRDALNAAFRNLHTLKGASAIIDLPPLTHLLHTAESRLVHAREQGALPRTSHGLLTRVLDNAEDWIEALEADRETSGEAASADQLRKRFDDETEAKNAPSEDVIETPPWARALAAQFGAEQAVVAIRYTPAPNAYFRGDDPLAILRGVPGLLKAELRAPPPQDPIKYDPFRCTLTIEALSSSSLTEVQATLRLVSDEVELAMVEAAQATRGDALQLRTLRVDSGKLDAVAALVDQLVIARNGLAHEVQRLIAAAGAEGRTAAAQEAALNRVVGDLHAAVTGLRLAPLEHLFSRFQRRVRDIAESLGKNVELRTSGEEVALDKSVVEGLFEPLLHLVRNAIDHGVETRADRRAASKPETAVLSLAARADGTQVIIELADDGRGIDVERTRATAVRRGLLDQAAASALSDDDAAELVFAAGFSTAEAVSEISGRGVGMDAMRAAVIRMGGKVALANRPGQGLTVCLTLPANVLLTRILVVRSGEENFGIPLDAIEETHRVQRDDVKPVRLGRAYVRRDSVIPLLVLSELVGGIRRPEPQVFPVLNVWAGGERIGIQVDEIGERLEAPMRPLAGLVSRAPGVLGTVVQGDGRVLLVLDLAELAA